MGTFGSHLRKAFGLCEEFVTGPFGAVLSTARAHLLGKLASICQERWGCSCSGIQIQKVKLDKILSGGREGTVRGKG